MRGFLLDTEALLAARARRDDRSVATGCREFLAQARRERWIVCVSALSLASVGRRLARLRRAQRREAHDYLWAWLERLLSLHPQAVLPFDATMAVSAAHLELLCGARPVRAALAACALAHDLAIVTSRPERYAGLGVGLWVFARRAGSGARAAAAAAAAAASTSATGEETASVAALVQGQRNSAAARGVRWPLGPVPGLETRPSRFAWGYRRGRRV